MAQMANQLTECVTSLGNKLTLVHTIGQQKKSTFDGTNADNFLKWVAEVDNIYLETNRDERQTIWAAAQLLRGFALEYYHDIAANVHTWEDLKASMTEFFSYLSPDVQSKQKLRNIVQKPNESVPQYAERLRTLAKHAYGGREAEREVIETIAHAFINGLRDRRLQEKVARKMPTTLQEAYSHAMQEIKIDDHISMFADHSNEQVIEPMDISAVSAKPDPLQTQLNKVADLLQVLVQKENQRPQTYQVSPQVNQQYRHASQQHQRPPYPPRFPPNHGQKSPPKDHTQPRVPKNDGPLPDYRWTPDRKPICHFCGNIGHIQRVCRKKMAAQGRLPTHPARESEN